jgi:hypothetical protein
VGVLEIGELAMTLFVDLGASDSFGGGAGGRGAGMGGAGGLWGDGTNGSLAAALAAVGGATAAQRIFLRAAAALFLPMVTLNGAPMAIPVLWGSRDV